MRVIGTVLLVGIVGLAPSTAASAMSVSYVDGGEVWQSTLDGARKVKLSNGEGGFREVAQADGGRTVGVRRADGERPEASRFVIWNADGTRAHEGPLLYEVGSWTTRAYPLALDIAPDGGSVVYGFSNSYYNAALLSTPFVFERGTVVMSAQNTASFQPTIFAPMKQSGREWPTLVGGRIVARSGAGVVLQRGAAGVPYTNDFDPWLTGPASPVPAGYELERTDVAAVGTVAAVEYEKRAPSGSTIVDRRIDIFPVAGVGGAPDYRAGCRIPAQGWPFNVSISPDGTRVAWQDDGGVKVAGIPDFSGVDDCRFTAPEVVISPTGSYPSIGGASPPATSAAGGSGSGGAVSGGAGGLPSGALKLLLPARVSAAALRRGVRVTVEVPAAGPVTVTLSVPAARVRGATAVVIARGRTVAKARGRVTVRLTVTKVARAKLRRLRGASATVKVTAGGQSATARVRLR